jgi:hypothetical protein
MAGRGLVMKITKLFGFMMLGLALVFITGCPGGQMLYNAQLEADQQGIDVEIEGGGGGTILAAEAGDPFCAPNNVMPAGLDAYAEIHPNGIFDRRIPFVYNLMRDDILSDEGLPEYDEYYFGGERGNIWAIFRTIFDDKLRQAAGIGFGDIGCISLGIETKTGNLCQGERSCFGTWDRVQDSLRNLPFIGAYLAQVMMIFPEQYRDLFGIFQVIEVPDPLVIFQELTSGDVEIMMVMDWEPGALVPARSYSGWASCSGRRRCGAEETEEAVISTLTSRRNSRS